MQRSPNWPPFIRSITLERMFEEIGARSDVRWNGASADVPITRSASSLHWHTLGILMSRPSSNVHFFLGCRRRQHQQLKFFLSLFPIFLSRFGFCCLHFLRSKFSHCFRRFGIPQFEIDCDERAHRLHSIHMRRAIF